MTCATRALAATAFLTVACGSSRRPEIGGTAPVQHRAVANPIVLVAPPPDPCHAPPFEVETLHEAPGATSLTADARNIFWSDGSDVWSAPLEGGAPRKILENQGARPIRKLRIAGDRLLVLQKEEDPQCVGRVVSADRTGGSLHGIGNEACVRDFDVNGEWLVYTTEINGAFDAGLQGTLWKAKADGSPPRDLFNLFDGVSHVVTDGKHAYVGLAIDQLHRVSLDNGNVMLLHDGIVDGHRVSLWHSHLAVDAHHVFFVVDRHDLKGPIIHRIDKEPRAEAREPVALGRMFPRISGSGDWPRGDLLQTATHLYWPAFWEGRILRVAKDGHCPVEELAANRNRPNHATPAGKYVVWVDQGGETHTVMRRRVSH